MKISALFATLALAQEGPDGRAMSLNKKIENAQNKCSVYMSKAMVCEPPSGKIGKYTFRLDKVSPLFAEKFLQKIFPKILQKLLEKILQKFCKKFTRKLAKKV